MLTLRRSTLKTRTDCDCRKSPQAPKRAAWGGRVGWISDLFYKHPFMNLTFDIFQVSFILLKRASSICGPSCIFLTQIVMGVVFDQCFYTIIDILLKFLIKKRSTWNVFKAPKWTHALAPKLIFFRRRRTHVVGYVRAVIWGARAIFFPVGAATYAEQSQIG